MSGEVRAAVALEPGLDFQAIQLLCQEPGLTITGFVRAATESLPDLAQTRDPIVIVCRTPSPELLEFIRGAAEQRPERTHVVFFDGVANGFTRHAFAAGADDLVSADAMQPGSAAQVVFALEKAAARRGGESRDSSVGELITVLGPKGGTGKTLVSCNLTVALARAGASVILVDLDLQFGDVGLALGLDPERTSHELATSGGSLDQDKVADFLTRHSSGARVLLAPRRPDHGAAVSVGFLTQLLPILRTMADFVIIDTAPSFGPEVIAAIDASSEICLVAMLDALSLKNTRLALETLDLMGRDPQHTRVVLNRSDSKVGVNVADAGVLLDRTPDALIPSSGSISRSVNEAMPIVLGSANVEAREAFEQLARQYRPQLDVPDLKGARGPKKLGRFVRPGRSKAAV